MMVDMIVRASAYSLSAGVAAGRSVVLASLPVSGAIFRAWIEVTSAPPGPQSSALFHAIPVALQGRFDKMRTMPPLPVVCTLSPDALRARREGLLSDLVKNSARHEPLPDGLRLRFAPSGETLSRIAAAIEAERHCCRFLRFTLTVEPDQGQFALELTGPQGTDAFLAALLDV